jgi:hypothetical protein
VTPNVQFVLHFLTDAPCWGCRKTEPLYWLSIGGLPVTSPTCEVCVKIQADKAFTEFFMGPTKPDSKGDE